MGGKKKQIPPPIETTRDQRRARPSLHGDQASPTSPMMQHGSEGGKGKTPVETEKGEDEMIPKEEMEMTNNRNFISKVGCMEEDPQKLDRDQRLKCNEPWIGSTGGSEERRGESKTRKVNDGRRKRERIH